MAENRVNGFEEGDEEVSAEDLLDCLRGNTLTILLGTIRFLEGRGIPPGEWIDALGATFLLGWDLSDEWTPEDLLQAVIFNLEAFGGTAVQAEFGDDSASAVIERFPDTEFTQGHHLDDVDGDLILDLIRPIAAACGLDWSWRREGDRIVVETSRSGGHS